MTDPHRIQHMAALAKANQSRLKRSELRHRVHDIADAASSRRELADVLEEQHECMGSMRVAEALRWAWRMQASTVRFLLAEAECSDFKLVRDLSVRQRRVLNTLLREANEWRAA